MFIYRYSKLAWRLSIPYNIRLCLCLVCFSVTAEREKYVNQTRRRTVRNTIKSLFTDRNENVHATVISHHVIAPERSPRSGNVASTKADKRQDEPDKLVNTSPRNLELLAIAYTTENPNARRLDDQRDKRQMTLLTCVLCEKSTRAGRAQKETTKMDEQLTDL
jgi:hypothetical protein